MFSYTLRNEVKSGIMGDNTYGYAFDPIGNRLASSQEVASVSSVVNYDTSQVNAYTNIVVQPSSTNATLYDLDGNMTRNGDWSYGYNGENWLIYASNVVTGVEISYGYDYMGRRTST